MGKGSLVPPYAKHTLSLCQAEKLRLKELKDKIHLRFFCSQTFSIGSSLLSFLPLLPIMPKVWIDGGVMGGVCLSVWVFVCSVSVAVLLCSPGLAWNLLCKAGWPPIHRGPSASGSLVLGLNVSTTPRFFFFFLEIIENWVVGSGFLPCHQGQHLTVLRILQWETKWQVKDYFVTSPKSWNLRS